MHVLKVKEKCDAMRDLVPFVQFKKREKHPWISVTFSKIAGFSIFKLLQDTRKHKTLL